MCMHGGVLLIVSSIVYITSIILSIEDKMIIEPKIPQFLRMYIHTTYFFLGAVIYNMKNELCVIIKKLLVLISILLWLTNAFIQYVVSVKVFRMHSPEYSFSSTIQILVNIALFMIVSTHGRILIKNQALIVKLSKYSFGAYIIHTLVIAVINKISPNLFWIVQYVFVLFLSYLVSYFMNSIPIFRKTVEI